MGVQKFLICNEFNITALSKYNKPQYIMYDEKVVGFVYELFCNGLGLVIRP